MASSWALPENVVEASLSPQRPPPMDVLSLAGLQSEPGSSSIGTDADLTKANRLFLHFRNDDLEREFCAYYYWFDFTDVSLCRRVWRNFFLVKVSLVLGMLGWCCMVPLDALAQHEIVGTTIYVVSICLRFLPLPLSAVTLFVMCLKYPQDEPPVVTPLSMAPRFLNSSIDVGNGAYGVGVGVQPGHGHPPTPLHPLPKDPPASKLSPPCCCLTRQFVRRRFFFIFECLWLLCLSFFIGTLVFQAAMFNKEVEGYPVGTMLFCLFCYTIPRPRYHLSLIVGFFTIVVYTGAHLCFNHDLLFFPRGSEQWNPRVLLYSNPPYGSCNSTSLETSGGSGGGSACLSVSTKRIEIPCFIIGVALCQIVGIIGLRMTEGQARSLFLYERELESKNRDMRNELTKQLRLLQNILPKQYVASVKDDQLRFVRCYEMVSIVTSDICNFTAFCSGISADEVVSVLNAHFSTFDGIAEFLGVEKVKTIGDAYLAIGGMIRERRARQNSLSMTPVAPDEMELCQVDLADSDERFIMETFFTSILMGNSMIRVVNDHSRAHNLDIKIRVGVGCGRTIIGVLGQSKITFDCWGRSVSEATYMESHGVPSAVQVSDSIHSKTASLFRFVENGCSEIDGRPKWLVEGCAAMRDLPEGCRRIYHHLLGFEHELAAEQERRNAIAEAMAGRDPMPPTDLTGPRSPRSPRPGYDPRSPRSPRPGYDSLRRASSRSNPPPEHFLLGEKIASSSGEDEPSEADETNFVFVQKVPMEELDIQDQAISSYDSEALLLHAMEKTGSRDPMSSIRSGTGGTGLQEMSDALSFNRVFLTFRILPTAIDYYARTFEEEIGTIVITLFIQLGGFICLGGTMCVVSITFPDVIVNDPPVIACFVIFGIQLLLTIVFVVWVWIEICTWRQRKGLAREKLSRMRSSSANRMGKGAHKVAPMLLPLASQRPILCAASWLVIGISYATVVGFGAAILFSRYLSERYLSTFSVFPLLIMSFYPLVPFFVRVVIFLFFFLAYVGIGFWAYYSYLSLNSLLVSAILIGGGFAYAIFSSYVSTYASMKSYKCRKMTEAKALLLLRETIRSKNLLLSVLPSSVLDRLAEGEILESVSDQKTLVADKIEDGCVLFISIDGFESECLDNRNEKFAFSVLNDLWNIMDKITDAYSRCYKIKCTGTTFIAVSGIQSAQQDEISRIRSTQELAMLALDIRDRVVEYLLSCSSRLRSKWSVKVGLNTGDFIAGVLGTTKFLYDVFGSSVNISSRLCSTGVDDKIHIAGGKTRQYVGREIPPVVRFSTSERGVIEMKGLGEVMTYHLEHESSHRSRQ